MAIEIYADGQQKSISVQKIKPEVFFIKTAIFS